MGILAKTLANVSSYGAKNTGLWNELMDRLTECVLPADVDAVERWIDENPLSIPVAWSEPLAEVIAKRREEIDEDDVASILRRNFDF